MNENIKSGNEIKRLKTIINSNHEAMSQALKYGLIINLYNMTISNSIDSEPNVEVDIDDIQSIPYNISECVSLIEREGL